MPESTFTTSSATSEALTVDDIKRMMDIKVPQPRTGIYGGTVDEAASFVLAEMARMGRLSCLVESRHIEGGQVFVMDNGRIVASPEVVAKVREHVATLRRMLYGVDASLSMVKRGGEDG